MLGCSFCLPFYGAHIYRSFHLCIAGPINKSSNCLASANLLFCRVFDVCPTHIRCVSPQLSPCLGLFICLWLTSPKRIESPPPPEGVTPGKSAKLNQTFIGGVGWRWRNHLSSHKPCLSCV